MKNPSLDLDTSVISALFDTRTPERKAMTEEFWEKLENHQIYISILVKEEIDAVKAVVKEKIQKLLKNFQTLKISKDIETLADEYIKKGIIPEKFRSDAIHVAIAVINNVDFLVSWNFRHLVKVRTRKAVNEVNIQLGYPQIEIIAPPEL